MNSAKSLRKNHLKRRVELACTSVLAPFTRVGGETYFAFAPANRDGIAHFLSLGTNVIGFEDQYGGGDRDYGDQVLAFSFRAAVL